MTRAFALLVALCGCASTSLDGSLSDQVPLAFDRVEIEHSATAIAVIYVKDLPRGGGYDTVLKVVAATKDVALDRASSIDLVEKLDGVPRGSVARAVADDARRDFPPLVRGRLSFDGVVDAGKDASGTFTVLFDRGGSVGAGRTVYGSFVAKVKEAGP